MNKYTYIIICIVIVFVIILIYQKNQRDKDIIRSQQLLLAQNQNTTFGQNQNLLSSLIGGLGAGIGSNIFGSGGGKNNDDEDEDDDDYSYINDLTCGKNGNPPCTTQQLVNAGWTPSQVNNAQQASTALYDWSLCYNLGINC